MNQLWRVCMLRFASFLVPLLVFLACPHGAWAQDVAFVLAATPEKRVLYESPLRTAGAAVVLPTQVLRPGHKLRLAKGARLGVAIVADQQTTHRRVYLGPARLLVKTDHIAVLEGPKPQVSPLPEGAAPLIAQWQEWQVWQREHKANQTPSQPAAKASALSLVEPKFDEVLLHRHPVLVWSGTLPREASLVVFDGQGKRFWSQTLEEPTVEFPHTVDFEWGQSYRVEVRKATGGRVFEGQFEIASEATAKDLLAERANYLSTALPEWRLLYAMRLHLARAYSQARPLWQALGLSAPLP